MRETPVQQRVRLDAAYSGANLWRNNCGVAFNEEGQPVRFGLANDSAELNHRIKSSDLIGVVPTLVTQEMVGYILGIFAAVECKESNWKFTPGDKRAVAQAAYHDIVLKSGGMAGFATCVEDYRRITWKL